MSSRVRPIVAALAALTLTLITVAPAYAVRLDERRNGVHISVEDAEGTPLVGVEVQLAPAHMPDSPMALKSNRRGMILFPRVEFYTEGYVLSLSSDEHYIKHFHFKVRRPSREIFQDDKGQLSPNQQEHLPKLRYRGGNATVYLTLGDRAAWEAERAQFFAEEEKKAAASAAASPKPSRELTPREEAEEALALGDYSTAATKFGVALEAAPEDVDLRWEYAQALASSGDSGAALRNSHKVIAAQPERAGVRLQMARWMDERGRLGGAQMLLEKERELAPENTSVLRLLYQVYKENGMGAEAEQTIVSWTELAPEDPAALVALASLRSEQGRHAESEALFERIAAVNPDEAHMMYFNAGVSILNQKGKTKEDRLRAIAVLKKAIAAKEDYARAHLMIADSMLGVGDFAGAKKHYARFVELMPESSEAARAKQTMSALP